METQPSNAIGYLKRNWFSHVVEAGQYLFGDLTALANGSPRGLARLFNYQRP